MKFPVKKVLSLAGSILAVLAICFVAKRLYSYMGDVDFAASAARMWFPLLYLSVFFAVANLCLVKVWGRALAHFDIHASYAHLTWVYGISQLAKYIPGNIFHLAGRQALGMAEQLPAGKLMKSIVWELGILATGAAGLFCPVFALSFVFPSFPFPGFLGIFAVCCCLVPWLAGRVLETNIRAGILWSALYLAAMGVIFVSLLVQISEYPLNVQEAFIVAIAYVAAWFVGFVTPGAPAGMGMREAAMLLLTRTIPIPEADILLTVMFCRIVTTFGDLLFFLGSIILKTYMRRMLSQK